MLDNVEKLQEELRTLDRLRLACGMSPTQINATPESLGRIADANATHLICDMTIDEIVRACHCVEILYLKLQTIVRQFPERKKALEEGATPRTRAEFTHVKSAQAALETKRDGAKKRKVISAARKDPNWKAVKAWSEFPNMTREKLFKMASAPPYSIAPELLNELLNEIYE